MLTYVHTHSACSAQLPWKHVLLKLPRQGQKYRRTSPAISGCFFWSQKDGDLHGDRNKVSVSKEISFELNPALRGGESLVSFFYFTAWFADPRAERSSRIVGPTFGLLIACFYYLFSFSQRKYFHCLVFKLQVNLNYTVLRLLWKICF